MLALFGFGPHFDLALLAVGGLIGSIILLWHPGQSPILVFTFVLHWIGTSVAVFHAHWLGIDLSRYSQFNGDLQRATVLSLFGILFVAVGMRVGSGKPNVAVAEATRRIALGQPLQRWFVLYCLASAIAFVAAAATWVVPGLSQVMLAIAGLRWAFFFVLAYATFVRSGGGMLYLALAFGFELSLGIGGFFSDFKVVFLFTIYAAFASGLRLTPRLQTGLAALVVGLVGLIVVWTGVKTEYRQFVADGRSSQTVSVDYVTRMSKLAEMVGALDGRQVEAGFDTMLRRLSYVEFFSVVLGHVPASIPHEDGALLLDAVTRPFLPRILFPDKSAIDDTERTNYYTGGLAGNSEATSISIGFVGEAYIDFGGYGMMIGLFAIGLGYGLIYRLLSNARTAGSLIGMGMATAVLQGIGLLETSITKLVGGLAVSLIVAGLLMRYVIPALLPWATRPSEGP